MNIVCTRTFESINKYNRTYCWNYCKERVWIDYTIIPIIKVLNDKGYITTSCCSGHLDEIGSIHIGFEKNVVLPYLPKKFTFNEHLHINVLARPSTYFTRKMYSVLNCSILDVFRIIQKSLDIYFINKQLYKWACSLPDLKPETKPCSDYDKYGPLGIKKEDLI